MVVVEKEGRAGPWLSSEVGRGWEVVRSCQQVVSRENVRRECCNLIIPTQSNTALGGDSM